MKKPLAIIALAAACVLPARAEILEQILVKVNGEILTKTDLEDRQVASLRQQNRGVTAKDLRNDAELKKALEEVTPQIVADAIDEMLVLQRGRELNLRMTDEQFKSILENIRKENKLESDDAFEAALKQEGLTVPDLRRQFERQMIVSGVQQREVWNKVAISDTEAREYYDSHQAEFSTTATLTLREIFVNVAEGQQPSGQPAGINVGLDEEARDKIDRLRVRALGGDDFAKLAAAESDAPSKANGGLIGPISEDELAPALRQLFERMKVGEITQPLRSQRGYQILKLEARTETKSLPFEEARDKIADKVFEQKRRGEMDKYLQKLRAQAIIEWKNDDIKKLYEQELAKRQAEAASSAPSQH
jgi:peptidyl-prolyl cis-trans isomerase SurA